MYFWKCWHSTRCRFLICLFVLSGLMTMVGLFGSRRGFEPARMDHFWMDLASARVPLGGFLLPMAAVGIAASAVMEELATGSSGYLFTRPRRRRYFVWTSWAVGVLELAALIVIPVLCCALVGLCRFHQITSWQFLSVFAFVLPLTAVVYGMTQFAIVLGNGARQGAAISLLTILVYIVTAQILPLWYGLRLPNWWLEQLALSSSPPTGFVALLAVAGWSAFSLTFPLATQGVVNHREY
jgi:ABC-type transport system involved in multi-copper enzyme maturation permease subunit